MSRANETSKSTLQRLAEVEKDRDRWRAVARLTASEDGHFWQARADAAERKVEAVEALATEFIRHLRVTIDSEASPHDFAACPWCAPSPAPCPRCDGAGIVDTSPPGVDRAPWLSSDTDCARCGGSGEIPDTDIEESP